jgi:hypothetical protein
MDQYGKVIEVFLIVTDVVAFVWVNMNYTNFTHMIPILIQLGRGL